MSSTAYKPISWEIYEMGNIRIDHVGEKYVSFSFVYIYIHSIRFYSLASTIKHANRTQL